MNTGKCTACGGVTLKYSENRFVCPKCHAEYATDNMETVRAEMPMGVCVICKKSFPQNMLGTIKDVNGNSHKICRECYYAMRDRKGQPQPQPEKPVSEQPPVAPTTAPVAQPVGNVVPEAVAASSTAMPATEVKAPAEVPTPVSQPISVDRTTNAAPKKSKKKVIGILAGVVVVAVTLGVLWALGVFHKHAFGEWKTVKAATCTEEGLEERVCKCGEKETQAILATGHTFGKWTVLKEATCSNKGKQERVCKCGEKETKEIPLTTHKWEKATCKKPKTCKVCGKTEGQPSAHDWKEATCGAPKTCKVCGKKEGSALGHSFGDADNCVYCKKSKSEVLVDSFCAYMTKTLNASKTSDGYYTHACGEEYFYDGQSSSVSTWTYYANSNEIILVFTDHIDDSYWHDTDTITVRKDGSVNIACSSTNSWNKQTRSYGGYIDQQGKAKLSEPSAEAQTAEDKYRARYYVLEEEALKNLWVMAKYKLDEGLSASPVKCDFSMDDYL